MSGKEVVVSSSLICTEPRVALSKKDGKRFCLGLPEWCPCEDCQQSVVANMGDCDVHMVEDSVTSKVCQSGFNAEIDHSKPLKLKRKGIGGRKELSKEANVASEKEGTGDSEHRFVFEVTSDELNKLKEGYCLANTAKNNAWALKTFEEWRIARNSKFPLHPCPENILTLDSKEIVCSSQKCGKQTDMSIHHAVYI